MDTGTYRQMFVELSNWGRWGVDDEKGALNYITADTIRSATALVQTGQTISLARPLATKAGIDNRKPAIHAMTQLAGSSDAPVQWNTDFIGADYHGKAITHVDALAHCAFDGAMYNGVAQAEVGPEGARRGGIGAVANGVVGRGVLLDVPRFRGVAWLEPGTTIEPEELASIEEAQTLRVGSGDVVLVRTGHELRQQDLGVWDSNESDAGLDVRAGPWLHERQVAVLGSDGDNDASPSTVEGVHLPIHALALVAMGVLVVDNLHLEGLAEACASEGRWEFLVMIAPLRVPGATGSPVNPIAVL